MKFSFAWKHEKPGFNLDYKWQGEAKVLGIFGPSGSGKTTLLRLMAGLEKPSFNGFFSYDENILTDTKKSIDIAPFKRKLAYLTQHPVLFPHLKVKQQIQIGGCNGHLEELISICYLDDLMEKYPNSLSGGEKQRVALARTFSAPHDLILLDEPLSFLDDKRKKAIMDFLKNYKQEMIYVSHDMTELKELNADLIYINNGQPVGENI